MTTKYAQQDGNWSDDISDNTWYDAESGGSAVDHPVEGDNAIINAGIAIMIDDAAAATIVVGDDNGNAIDVKGTLQYLSTAGIDHILRCKGNLYITAGGSLHIGTAANPIPATRTFTIQLNYSASLAIGKYGLLNSGDLILQGDPARITVTNCLLNANGAVDATGLVSDVSTGWKDNDNIAIASTSRTWSEVEDGAMNGDASGTTLTIDGFSGVGGGLANAHQGTNNSHGDSCRAEIINLTRNVKITSYDASFEGYVLLDVDSTCDIDYVEFYELGQNTADKYGFVVKTVATSNVHYSSFYNMYRGLSIPRYYSDLLTFDHNVIYNTTNYGIYSDAHENEVITYNIVIKASSYGLYFNRPRLDGHGNVVTSCSSGVYFNGYSPINLDDITIHSSGSSYLRDVFSSPAYNTLSNWKIWRNSAYMRLSLSVWTFDNWLNFGCSFRYNGNLTTFTSLRMYNETVYSSNYGFDWDGGLKNKFIDCEIGTDGTYSTGDFDLSGLSGIVFRNCKISSPTNFHNMSNTSVGTSIEIEDYNQVHYQDLAWYKYGKVTRDSTTFKTGSYAMRFDQFWVANAWLEYDLYIPVKDGEQIVASVWIRKNASYTSANRPKIVLSGMGITEDEAQMSDVTDTWERITVKGTPTRTGLAKLTIKTYLTNSGASAWADMAKTDILSGVLNTIEGDFWADGHMANVLMDTGSITAAEFWKILLTDIDKVGSFGNLLKNNLDAQVSLIKTETDKIQTGIIDTKNDYKATGFATQNPPSQVLDDYKADVTNLDVAVSTRNATTPPTVEEIRTEMDTNSTKLSKIKSITNFIRTKII